MSGTIILEQVVVKISVSEMLDSYREAKNISMSNDEMYASEFEYYFDCYNDYYYLLLEKTKASNVVGGDGCWFNCVPVSKHGDLICNYIKQALTSFEGGMSRFKGSSYTSPESALRKLRKSIANAIDFKDFRKANGGALEFVFYQFDEVTRLPYDQARDERALSGCKFVTSEDSKKVYSRCFSKGDMAKKSTIRVGSIHEFISVIIVDGIADSWDKYSKCSVQSSSIGI